MKPKSILIALLLTLSCLAGGITLCQDTGEEIPAHTRFNPYYQPSALEALESGRGVNEWTGSGPWGGNVRGLVTDPANPQRVLAACGSSLTAVEGGVYLSLDGGLNWQPTTLPRKQYNAVAVSESQPGVFYAGARNGLYKSVDNGVTWDLAALSTAYILGVGVKANDGNTIVVGKSGNTGIVVSTDGGNNFVQVGLNGGFMRMFSYSAVNPGRMFVVMGSAASSVMTSIDNGQSWTPWGPAGDGWGMYNSPTDSLFCLIAHANGIYRTTDGGANWTLATGGTFRSVTGYNGVYYATSNSGGVMKSNDLGQTWSAVSPQVPQSNWQSATATGAGALLGHWGGIFRATGFNDPVVASHTGLNLALVHGLAYYSDTNELWGGTEGSGLYRSTDGGVSWQQMVNGLNNWMVYELAPTNHQYYQSGRMLAGTLDGAYTSTDGGQTWSYAYYQGTQVSACEVHPTDPNKFWLGSSMGEIRYTDDGGQSWTVATGGMWGFAPRLKLGRGPAGNLRIFLSYQGNATAVWFSDDGIAFTAGTGMEGTTYQPMVAVRPQLDTQPQIIYASSNSGVYKSTDGGASYTLAGMPGFSWSVLSGPGQQVISGKDNGLSYSTDEGATSTSLTQNLEASANIWQMAWGTSTNQVYIAMRTRGVMENRFSATDYGFPADLAAIPDDQSVILMWTPVSQQPAPTAYCIWRDGYPLAQVPAGLSTFTDSGLLNGQAYKYFVSAVYADHIQTSPTQIVTAVPAVPDHQAPTDLAATVYMMDVILTWTQPSAPYLTGYLIQRDGEAIATLTNPAADNYIDTNLANGVYTYSVIALYPTGQSEPATTDATVDYVYADDPGTPALVTGLRGIFPNPFNPQTSVSFSLKDAAPVSITIYDPRGRKVRTLAAREFSSGQHSLAWDGKDDSGQPLASGVYFCRMNSTGYTGSRKMLLLK
ncbi:MAG: FlgD immunoglobulin-like domain containing protein [Candidatus Cloacimonetes bacterium]|nr:FlgD immunoglobulin-like domain containing protein [Candidatus Cloacimonadota bacterium]